MTTIASEFCEDTEDQKRLQLKTRVLAVLSRAEEPQQLGQPGNRYFCAHHMGKIVSMIWRHDATDKALWPKHARPLKPVHSIMINVGKAYTGIPVTLYNGTAHPGVVNAQGIISFQGEDALKIFTDTSDLRFEVG